MFETLKFNHFNNSSWEKILSCETVFYFKYSGYSKTLQIIDIDFPVERYVLPYTVV